MDTFCSVWQRTKAINLQTSMRTKILIALITGTIVGVITSRYLFVNSWLGLIPWALGGALLGAWCANRKQAAALGAVYGFFLLFSFMFGGYQGAASLVSRILPFAALGLAGAVGGIVASEIGQSFRKR